MSKPKRKPVDLRRKPAIEVMHNLYQPSKAELEADVSIPATPEELAKALMGDVTLRTGTGKR